MPNTAPRATFTTLPTLGPAESDAVGRLLAEAAAADGVAPVSEETRLAIRATGGPVGGGARDGGRHVLVAVADAPADAAPAAYGHLDGDGVGEFVVAPAFRGRGIGRGLLAALLELARAAAAEPRFWAHGGLPAARHLAETSGLRGVRELLTMRRPLRPGPAGDAALPPAELPPGVTVRAFEPGRDDDAWLAVNARAFAHHPEQGSWTDGDLRVRVAEPWFDRDGFFLAERAGELVGFHWTKVDPPGGAEGEVYVVGVDPAAQGLGLGRALTLVGLHHLRNRGLDTVMLYVDGDNTAALRTYRGLGFVVTDRDLMYAA